MIYLAIIKGMKKGKNAECTLQFNCKDINTAKYMLLERMCNDFNKWEIGSLTITTQNGHTLWERAY